MADSDKQCLINELILAVTDLQNAADLVDQAISDSLGLNRTDARCLACLITHGPLTAGDLAGRAGLTPGALTFAVDRLAQAGYAQRGRASDDRRRVVVTASEKAHQLAQEVWGQTILETERQLAKYTSEQIKLLTGFVCDQVELQRRHANRIRDTSR